MTRKILGFLNGIFKGRRKYYLIVEERDGRFEATRAALDGERKNIFILQRRTAGNPGDIRRPWRPPEKIIFSLGGQKAATAESVVAVRRSAPGERIAAEELEQLVFKALWEFLNRYRPWAGKKLKAPDVDLILSDIQVRDVLLNDRRIFNPVGFDGREISFRLRGTFIGRSVLPLVAKFRSWGPVAVVEGGSILTDAVPADGEWLALPDEASTPIYRRREEESAFEGEINWDIRRIAESIRREFLLEPEALPELFRRYERGEVSDKLKRLMDALIRNGLTELGDAAHAHAVKGHPASRPRVYFHLRLPLAPQAEWLKYLRGDILRLDERLERENFTIAVKAPAAGFSPARDQATLALLLYSYDAPQYGFLNDVLRRRARWLIPNF
jgi:hypothetical protein